MDGYDGEGALDYLRPAYYPPSGGERCPSLLVLFFLSPHGLLRRQRSSGLPVPCVLSRIVWLMRTVAEGRYSGTVLSKFFAQG